MIMSGEYVRILKEVVMPFLDVLSQHLTGESEEHSENPHVNQYTGQDSNCYLSDTNLVYHHCAACSVLLWNTGI
jgi:hypothetical protein